MGMYDKLSELRTMNFTTTQVEEELKKLVPARFSESFIDRLDAAMGEASAEVNEMDGEVIITSADHELEVLEKRLRDLVPYGVPENMISQLDKAMARWHEVVPVEEKIISIHPEVTQKKSSFLGLRSVAAVALLGVGAAFLSGVREPASSLANSEQIPDLSHASAVPAVFTSENAESSVVSQNDHGVIWTKGGQPVHCTEVYVKNRLQFANAIGERLTFEQPIRELRFTSVRFD